jgi:hypothetical protein
MPELDALQREFERDVIGQLLLGEIEQAAREVSRRYDPETYGAGEPRWSAEALEDLVHDTIAGPLLSEGQLDYALHATDIGHFRALIRRQVRRTLIRRRSKTVIDALLERSMHELARPPFEQLEGGGRPRFVVAGRAYDDRPPTTLELRRAALAAAAVPTDRPAAGDRAPMVYRTDALRTLLQRVANELPCPFGTSELDAIFRLLLTGWFPSVLDDIEGAIGFSSRELGPEDALEVRETTERLLNRLSDEQKMILSRKLTGSADEEIASILRVSRPTVIKRRAEIYSTLSLELEGSSDAVRDAVIGELSLRLAAAE